MKKYIACSSEGNQKLIELLSSFGIDTTISTYELRAEEYERYQEGNRYSKKFKCPGNWLAYFSMLVHGQPSYENLEYELGDVEGELSYYAEQCPTVTAMGDRAARDWWGDGDDYIISLKNLTTGEVLYQGNEEYYEEGSEEEW